MIGFIIFWVLVYFVGGISLCLVWHGLIGLGNKFCDFCDWISGFFSKED